MAARARIEWVTLGPAHGTIREQFGAAIKLNVTNVATAAGDRPKAPTFGADDTGYALIRCEDNPIVVRRVPEGSALNASELNGHLIKPGEMEPILVNTGDELSFIEVPA